MTTHELQHIIHQGEDLKVEFKESQTSLQKNLFETVCAFLNTKGGTVVLGVNYDGQGALIEIRKKGITFSNPNNPIIFGKIAPKHFTSIAKNPTIKSLMIQMGRAEDIGSGIRNVTKYLPQFDKNAVVSFQNTDIFTTVVELDKTIEKILQLIRENSKITQNEMAYKMGLTRRGVEYQIERLKSERIITRESSDKEGRWIVSGLKTFPIGSSKSAPKTRDLILDVIRKNQNITIPELMQLLAKSNRAVRKQLLQLKNDRIIERIGSNRGGYWKVCEEDVGTLGN